MARRLLLHALLSLVLLYSVLGGYIYINATQNHFAGLTWIENINELGKILEYHMQNEAPPQYASISRTLDTYVDRGILDPYAVLEHNPSLSDNGAALSGAFAQSIIERHPEEFLVKSVPVFFSSLTVYYDESRVLPAGPFGSPLLWLQSEFRSLYKWNTFFPPCAAIWLLLLCWERTRHLRTVQAMGAVILLSLYGLIIITLGAYRGYDYTRIHTLFDPLLTLVIWGTLLAGALLTVQQGPGVLVKLAKQPGQQISISTGTLLIGSLSAIGLCLFTARSVLTHGFSSLIGAVFFFVTGVASILRYLQLSQQTKVLTGPSADRTEGKENGPL